MNSEYDKIWEAKRQHICTSDSPFVKLFDGSKYYYQKGATYDFCIFYHAAHSQFEISVYDPKEEAEKTRIYIGSHTVFDIIQGNMTKEEKASVTPEILLEHSAVNIMKRLSLKYGKIYFHLLQGDIMVKQFLLEPPCAVSLNPVTVKWNVGSNFTRKEFASRMETRMHQALVLNPIVGNIKARPHSADPCLMSSAKKRWVAATKKIIALKTVEKTRVILDERSQRQAVEALEKENQRKLSAPKRLPSIQEKKKAERAETQTRLLAQPRRRSISSIETASNSVANVSDTIPVAVAPTTNAPSGVQKKRRGSAGSLNLAPLSMGHATARRKSTANVAKAALISGKADSLSDNEIGNLLGSLFLDSSSSSTQKKTTAKR